MFRQFIGKVKHPLKFRKKFQLKHRTGVHVVDALTIGIMAVALLLLFSLIWYNLRPIKTVDIKVPVATDRSAYVPGEQIGGIFFGEIFYEGQVRVLREVYCRDYKAVIEPPAYAKSGDFFATQSIPRKLDGSSVNIGKLPTNIPVGKNCVLQFTNVYDIQTPFGVRHIEYRYYTQNFAIISQERRNLLDCEASGRTDCDKPDTIIQLVPDTIQQQQTPESPQIAPKTTPSTQTQPSAQVAPKEAETAPNEPVQVPRECSIDFLFVHLFCS